MVSMTQNEKKVRTWIILSFPRQVRDLIQRLEMQHKTPVFAKKYNAPKNRKMERPEVAHRMILKYHAVRGVDVAYVG